MKNKIGIAAAIAATVTGTVLAVKKIRSKKN